MSRPITNLKIAKDPKITRRATKLFSNLRIQMSKFPNKDQYISSASLKISFLQFPKNNNLNQLRYKNYKNYSSNIIEGCFNRKKIIRICEIRILLITSKRRCSVCRSMYLCIYSFMYYVRSLWLDTAFAVSSVIYCSTFFFFFWSAEVCECKSLSQTFSVNFQSRNGSEFSIS